MVWDPLQLIELIDEATEVLSEVIICSEKESIPTKTININSEDKPWINSELKRNLQKWDRLLKIDKKSNKANHNLPQSEESKYHGNNGELIGIK